MMRYKQVEVCFTFDVEDWFQTENLRDHFPLERWDNQILRVDYGTRVIIDILEQFQVKATFFILGWIAERVPTLVREITNRGHEIASHGYYHVRNSLLTPEELKNDIYKSKVTLENITGQRVSGYRAPTFSITEEVMHILKDLDFEYDSSLNTFGLNSRYGTLHQVDGLTTFVHTTGIIEIPMPTAKLWGTNIPIAGGGFFRLYPYVLFKYLVDKYLKENEYYVFYMHPWEFDPDQPKINKLRASYNFRQRVGLNNSAAKVSRLIKDYCKKSVTLGQVATQLKEDNNKKAVD